LPTRHILFSISLARCLFLNEDVGNQGRLRNRKTFDKILCTRQILYRIEFVTEQGSNRFKTVIWIKVSGHLSETSAIYSGLKREDALCFPLFNCSAQYGFHSVLEKRAAM
jgi:hypothetical protein